MDEVRSLFAEFMEKLDPDSAAIVASIQQKLLENEQELIEVKDTLLQHDTKIRSLQNEQVEGTEDVAAGPAPSKTSGPPIKQENNAEEAEGTKDVAVGPAPSKTSGPPIKQENNAAEAEGTEDDAAGPAPSKTSGHPIKQENNAEEAVAAKKTTKEAAQAGDHNDDHAPDPDAELKRAGVDAGSKNKNTPKNAAKGKKKAQAGAAGKVGKVSTLPSKASKNTKR